VCVCLCVEVQTGCVTRLSDPRPDVGQMFRGVTRSAIRGREAGDGARGRAACDLTRACTSRELVPPCFTGRPVRSGPWSYYRIGYRETRDPGQTEPKRCDVIFGVYHGGKQEEHSDVTQRDFIIFK